jgi:stage II sporulation protein D
MPQPGRAYRVTWAGGAAWLWGPLLLSSAGEQEWQVGAFADPSAANSAATAIASRLGDTVDISRSLTDEGLVRVRVRWIEHTGDQPADVLSEIGFPDAFPVGGASRVRLEGRGGPVEASGEVVVVPEGSWPTAVGDRRYHGRFRLRAGADGLLVINELNLEIYLRGVLPAEMGPAQFPELEALKAQAVAARTYTVAHLGDHEDEGYDLCDSPACQVYRGTDVHHPLSDRAVEETAGLIAVFAGEPIDAMYTSTCGGHTEDARLLFPDRAQPYLTGVACVWERPMVIDGASERSVFDAESRFRRHLAGAALGLSQDEASPQTVLHQVASLCGGGERLLEPTPGVDDYVGALLEAGGLGDASVLVRASGADLLVVLADLFEVPLSMPTLESWRDGWHLLAALAVLELQGVVTRDRGEAVPHPDGVAIYPRSAVSSDPLPSTVPLYWRWGGRYQAVPEMTVLPGATLERVRRGDDLLALIVVQSGGGAEADRRSAWRSWIRDRSWDELANGLGVPDLDDIEVTRRGASGRVVGLRAQGRSGSSKELEGFPIRLALGVPENLFSFHVIVSPTGRRVVRFIGRGWGHGVGLCQNGSYGLARAGQEFSRILATYYSGVEITRWPRDAVTQGVGVQ